MPGAGDPPRKRDQAEPAGDAPQPAQRVGHDRNDSPIRRAADSPADLRQRLNQFRDGHPSSPNHEDGSPREPAPDLSEFESAPETHEHEPSPSDHAAGRVEHAQDRPEGTADHPEGQTERTDGQPEHAASRGEAAEDQMGRAEHADSRAVRTDSQADNAADGNSEGWRAVLPRLQALWQRHTQCWPAEQRTPVDRSTDEPGSWRGDDGHYLNCEENLVTEHALDRVHKAEPDVSRTMKAVETEVPGARLVGLENCLKGEDRFKEKVSAELRAKPERSIAQIDDYASDALRYTYQFDTDRYVDGYWNVCRELQQNGCEMEFSRNSWESTQYKGINTRWRTPANQIYEVQFHTPDSFSAKELTHDSYERIRSLATTSDLEHDDLHDFQSEVTAQVPVPDGASAIPDYREREHDGG